MRQGLEQLEVYQLAMEIGELVWKYVANWDHFAKSTIGNNFVRSADSVAYNISEGYGRHFFRDNKNFCFIARGSLSETKTGAVKALNRNLISMDDYESLIEKIEICYPKLNNYIAYIDKQINTQ
jgi:four helix bundle protein